MEHLTGLRMGSVDTAVPGVGTTTTALRTLQIGWMTVANAPMTSGAERYYFELLRALPERGVTAQGVVLGALPPFDLGAASVEVLAPLGMARRERIARTRRRVDELLPQSELAVSHCAPHAFPVLDVVRRHGRPLVVHFHGPWALERLLHRATSFRFPLAALQELAVYRASVRVIVLFEAYARLLERLYRVAPERVRVIPGGVDLSRFRPSVARADARAWFGLPHDRPVIVSVARLAHGKAIGRLIDAFALVRRRVPDAVLVIAGNGPLADDARRRARERKLGEAVLFIGHRFDDLPLVYRAADVSVSTTWGVDGFGLVVAESLACGTPVLLIPLCGGASMIGRPGLRVLPGPRPSQIAAGLIEALRDGAVDDENVCRRAALPYDWGIIAERVRDVYREAL